MWQSFVVVLSLVNCLLGQQNIDAPTTTSKLQVIDKNPSLVGMKSRQKCEEYANLTTNDCGIKAVNLIDNEVKAQPTEFPHMAAIGFDGENGQRLYICGGSLISENFVLTAGHCLNSRDYGQAKYVRVGDLDQISQEVNVIQVIKHPDYRSPSKYNDIGLLKLESNVRFTPYVRPVCLNTKHNFDAKKAIVTGWSKTGYIDDTSNHLWKVTLELYGHNECNTLFDTTSKRLLANGIVDKTQVCAGLKTDQEGPCQLTSGGPLQILNPDVYCMYSQIGVTSFRICETSPPSSVYTRVSGYIDWIEKIVWP